MNITAKQKVTLLNYLKEHTELVRGRIDRKSESKRKLKDLWNEVAQIVNIAGEGPQKSGQEWAKTWKDMKTYILKKEAKRRNYIQGTGGGPPPKVPFSDFEEDVLQLLTPEAAGLKNIPQGGLMEQLPQEQVQLPQEDIQPPREYDSNKMQEQHMLSEMDIDIEQSTSTNIRNCNRRTETFTSVNNKRKDKSMQQLSYNMLEIQEMKLQLKKEELLIRKKQLEVQEYILSELKEIKLILQAYNGFLV